MGCRGERRAGAQTGKNCQTPIHTHPPLSATHPALVGATVLLPLPLLLGLGPLRFASSLVPRIRQSRLDLWLSTIPVKLEPLHFLERHIEEMLPVLFLQEAEVQRRLVCMARGTSARERECECAAPVRVWPL